MADLWVRFGRGGHVGVVAHGGRPLARGTVVVVRTDRGVDLGEVLGVAGPPPEKDPGRLPELPREDPPGFPEEEEPETPPESIRQAPPEESSRAPTEIPRETPPGLPGNPTDPGRQDPQPAYDGPTPPDAVRRGRVLRTASAEDRLLAARVHRDHPLAVAACERELTVWGVESVLLDAEVSLDGRQVRFEFLTEPGLAPADLDRLAEVYRHTAGLDQLGHLLTDGCGPGCGTAGVAGGCSTGGCASCGLSGACATTTRA